MKLIYLFNVILALTAARKLKSKARRTKQDKSMTVFNSFNWGSWQTATKAKPGYFACGVQITHKVWDSKSSNCGIDGLKVVYCLGSDWNTQDIQVANAAQTANVWKSQMCQQGSFINNINVQSDKDETHPMDHVAINQLKLTCYDPYQRQSSISSLVTDQTGQWSNSPNNINFYTGLQAQSRYYSAGDDMGVTSLAANFADFQCKSGFLLQNHVDCFKAIDQCKDGQQNGDVCASCQPNFNTEGGKCYSIIPNCKTQSQNSCSECLCGFDLNSNGCFDKVPNCSSQVQTLCQTCDDGFVTGSMGDCVIKIPNCSNQNDSQCLECNTSYVVYKNICQKDSNCGKTRRLRKRSHAYSSNSKKNDEDRKF